MGMRSFVGFGFVLALAVWACNSSSDDPSGGTGGTTGQVELEDGTVGSSCADSCQDGLQCAASASIPNGYCTATCTADDQCGAEGRCAQTKSGALCFRGCSDDNGCRPGYACVDAGGYSVCDVGTPAQGTGGSAQGTGGSTQTGDCNTVALPAEVSGGCNIRLVTPQNCEEIDLSGGRTYEFAWTTDTTMCETPFVLYILGNPPTQQNTVSWQFSDGSENGLVGKNTGGLTRVSAADLAGLSSDNGIYHWVVAGWYGSHPDTQTFRVRK